MKKYSSITIVSFSIMVMLIIGITAIVVISAADGSFSDLEGKENSDMFSELSYELPKNFKEDNYSTMKFISYDSNGAYFNLDISAREKKYYKTAENYLKSEVYFSLEDEVGELKEEEINGNKMLTLEVKRKYGNEHYYAMESSNYIYLFEFSIKDFEDGDREDIDSNPCFTAKNKILYSIKLK